MLSILRRGAVRLAAQPLVQFIVLGAILYGLYAWTGGSSAGEPDSVIRVTASDVNRLETSWRARWNRPPTEDEFAGLIRAHIREVALYRHAVAMGLDRDDPVVRRMLGQKLQTLTQNVLEFSLSPTDQELKDYYAENAEQYRPPDLITYSQVFLDPDRRGDETLRDAREILAKLRSTGAPTAEIESLGDSFMLQTYYPQKAYFDISRLFGHGFADSVVALSAREWHGPVLSGYGVHLVYVHEHETNKMPEFEAVKERVQQEWLDKRQRELQDEFVSTVVSSYDVVFEGTEAKEGWVEVPQEQPE